MDFLKDLNENQQQSATALEGPVMIVAGAGSGKTRVLTYRIAYAMALGNDPFRILALTFTNKAAREMRDRIECAQFVDGNLSLHFCARFACRG